MHRSHVLVTGGAGYIGSICAARLLECGHYVTIIDDLSTGHRVALPPDAIFIQADIRDRAEMRRLLAHGRYESVFHFAAKITVEESISDPGRFFDYNTAAGIALLEELRRAGITKFVFSST